MKLLVVSDSHGDTASLEMILQRAADCDALVHLGDGADDLDTLLRYTQGKAVYRVRGNCDPGLPYAERLVFRVAGKTVLACHGHKYRVETGPDRLYFEGLRENADLCLYGHTHRQAADEDTGILLLNPGAVKNRRYAVVTLDERGADYTFFEI
jgi:putative phosphoesterase